jgi:hypothetical protein
MLAGVSVKDSKETLTTNACVVDHEGMRIFHISPCTFVLRHANLIGIVLCRVTIQELDCQYISKIGIARSDGVVLRVCQCHQL